MRQTMRKWIQPGAGQGAAVRSLTVKPSDTAARRDEQIGHDPAALRMAPAKERFHAHRASGADADFGL